MIRRSATLALAFSTALLGACQTGSGPQMLSSGPERTALDGQWASGDGISVTTFNGGQFTTRFVKTNEVLAQGTYTTTGNSIGMEWLSIARQEQFSASCSLAGSDTMHCTQSGGGGFDLRRTA